MSELTPFNPLDKANLGKSVADALLQQARVPLGDLKSFKGVGVYAIYYAGQFEPYRRLTEIYALYGIEVPIYVGKADPEGKRKGLAQLEASSSTKLNRRLNEHAASVRAVTNLNIEDFSCRYLVVDEIWIPLGEALLIARFAPVWNQLVDGFGNHPPGSGRQEGKRSRWDVLHPGRKWTETIGQHTETADQIANDVIEHLRSSVIISRLITDRSSGEA